MEELTRDSLHVKIFESRVLMGSMAAKDITQRINKLLEVQEHINVVFAAAPSQNDFLNNFSRKDIEWDRINAFHMDEYVGLNENAPQLFGNFLRDRLFGKVPFRSVHYFNGNADDLEQECMRYTNLIEEHPTDICILGIGENTHLAFCDPHVADFNDPKAVKVVSLDEQNRIQQVNDGMFNHLDDVPTKALTLTIPTLFRSTYTYAIVPTSAKAQAISHTLNSEIMETYPSTVLRKHPHSILYLDEASAAEI